MHTLIFNIHTIIQIAVVAIDRVRREQVRPHETIDRVRREQVRPRTTIDRVRREQVRPRETIDRVRREQVVLLCIVIT